MTISWRNARRRALISGRIRAKSGRARTFAWRRVTSCVTDAEPRLQPHRCHCIARRHWAKSATIGAKMRHPYEPRRHADRARRQRSSGAPGYGGACLSAATKCVSSTRGEVASDRRQLRVRGSRADIVNEKNDCRCCTRQSVLGNMPVNCSYSSTAAVRATQSIPHGRDEH